MSQALPPLRALRPALWAGLALLAVAPLAAAPPIEAGALAVPVAPIAPVAERKAEPTSFLTHALGHPAEIKVEGVEADETEALFGKMAAEISEVEKLADPTRKEGEIARLNDGTQDPSKPLDVRLVRLLDRARELCVWSDGAVSPVGGALYAQWGLRQAPPAAGAEGSAPPADRLRQAVAASACGGIEVDPLKATVRLAPGAKIEPWGFSEGLAVDRLAEVLLASGYKRFLVQVGTVWRASGDGPEGAGWLVDLPVLPGHGGTAGRVRLQDTSMALILDPRKVPSNQGKAFAGYLNQRTGRPPEGTLATAAITTVALDAQGLAVALFALGSREGQFRLGSLQPKPSACWWMGSGEGEAVQVSHRWSEVTRP